MTESLRLVMTQGPQPGQTFSLDKDFVTIGRDPVNDITINSPKVSRQHARLVRRGGVIVLEDLGSTNGTFVNGMRLTSPHTLASGDVISLGDVATFTFYGQPADADETVVGQPSAAPPSGYSPTAHLGGDQGPAADAGFPPPPQAYAPPMPDPHQEAPKKSRTGLWIGCGCGALLVLAALTGVVFYLDAYFPNILYAPLRWLGF